jgi:tetratricopeptide (TPR) repeat protein
LNLVGEAKPGKDGDWEYTPAAEKKVVGERLSEIGHGNIAPNPQHGGVSITSATRIATVSLAGLDRIGFGAASAEVAVAARAALALNPNSAFVMSAVGLVLGRAGYHQEGIDRLRQAMRISPHDPLTWQWLNGIGDFQLFSRQFEAALETYRQVIVRRPGFFAPHLFSAAALAYLGRRHEAYDALLSAQAQFAEQIERRRNRPSWARPEDWAVKTEGLRLAAERLG